MFELRSPSPLVSLEDVKVFRLTSGKLAHPERKQAKEEFGGFQNRFMTIVSISFKSTNVSSSFDAGSAPAGRIF